MISSLRHMQIPFQEKKISEDNILPMTSSFHHKLTLSREDVKLPISTHATMDIPKGYLAIYVGEQEKKRFVVSVSLLSQPDFQELLHQAEEEFGYYHPMGGLTITCSEYVFTNLASRCGAF
ncbi:hypothetical protein E3N88_18667 [Mikania micrantha]|uniref:Uncharacterized protein n=1 Tax=Mikania micrantha TaxID=192012 RepID=A0A5N6NL23_9ASTR|nr:hypothetical protein E3N88_18667 [Mikania micrantha]